MEQRILAKPDVSVTVLGFGAMEIPQLGGSEASALLNQVLDEGINFIDTSPCYKNSEELIGGAIAGRRKEYFLASKCCCNTFGPGPAHIFDRATAMKNIESSLKLLKTDYLDILQLHAPLPGDLSGPKDDLIEALYDMKKAGKIRHASISFKNAGPTDPKYPALYGLESIQAFMDWGVFDTMQIVMGGLTRLNELAIAKAAGKGIGIIVRGALKRYFPNYDELFDKAGLAELCEAGEDRNSFLLRYAISSAGVKTVIVGTKNAAHLKANVAAAGKGNLSDKVYKKAQEKLAAIGIAPGAV